MRILLAGAFGCGNIGDDAILEGVLKILRRAVPEVHISVTCGPLKIPEPLSGAGEIVDYYDEEHILLSILASDCLILGGGTQIGEELGIEYPLGSYARLVATAKHHGKGCVLLAIGANRLTSKSATRIGEIIVKSADMITVRDVPSLESCIALGSDAERNHVTADPAFLVDPTQTARSSRVKDRIRSLGKALGVNMVNEAWENKLEYKAAVAKACEVLFRDHRYTPVFFCNEVRSDSRGDAEANRQTAAMLQCDHLMLDPTYFAPGEMIDIISSFDCVLAMRMHPILFSAVAGRPFVSISRADKIANCMALFGMKPTGTVDRVRWQNIVRDVTRIAMEWPSRGMAVSERVAKLSEGCLRNVEVVKSVLQDPRIYTTKTSWKSRAFLLSGKMGQLKHLARLARRIADGNGIMSRQPFSKLRPLVRPLYRLARQFAHRLRVELSR